MIEATVNYPGGITKVTEEPEQLVNMVYNLPALKGDRGERGPAGPPGTVAGSLEISSEEGQIIEVRTDGLYAAPQLSSNNW